MVANTGSEAVAAGVKAIRYMRENDCDFLTVENVQDYAGISEDAARCALRREMGLGWYAQMVAFDEGRRTSAGPLLAEDMRACGFDVIEGQVTVQTPEGRTFAVAKGRRWTRVAEYLTNGQLTARFFLDERTGEARLARSAKSPQSWPLSGSNAAFVRELVARAV